MRFLLKTILLAFFCACAHADPEPGLWYDPGRPGSGLSLHRNGNTYFAAVYDYDAASQPVWYFASNATYDGELDPGGPIYAGKLYSARGTPMLTREHQFFTPVEVGRLAIWQFRDTLTLSITFAPTCPTCEQRVVGHYYVRLM